MDKNAVPPKTKPPPSDSSEEETGSSDEETEDEEQAERGSAFESGSDESMGTPKKKLISILPSRQQPTAKAAAPAAAPDSTANSTAKRTRESNGKKDKVDESSNKKKKTEVTTPAPRSAPKPTAQQSEKKSATKTERVKPTPTVKEKLSAEKKSTTKRKTTSPVTKTSASSRSEDETPQKLKSLSRPWSSDEELALSRELQKDRVIDAYGTNLPSARSDPYWGKLMSRLPFMEKYEEEYRIERLCEKVRRMRLRYESLNSRIKAGETSVYKNPHEGVLWRIWHTIWGPLKATPRMLNGEDTEEDHEEDDEEEEDESDEEGSEEDDEEEIVPTQVKGRQAPTKKKAISKKAVADETSSDDDESNKDDSPVKATPPSVLAASAATAISGAGKQAPVSKSVPTKGAVVSAMDVDSGRNASRAGVHNGAQGGHALIPAMIEKSVRADALPKVSDEMRAENLALLRDMRGTCVKMVEEAKAQSLLITERILEETRVKTTQIVEEARVKSSQIMEELRSVAERQSGQRNGSHGGRWSDMSDNPYQGMGLVGELPSDDPNYVKWREHSEAEQGLILQRLQLVQDQARIQQEGIRLRSSIQKQQASAQGKQA